MKNTNKHLDDLFAAARHEDPIISEDNARELLSESQSMQPSFKLISTKGAIMTSIGLSLAAATAYLVFSGSPTTNPTPTNPERTHAANLFAHNVQSNTDEPKKIDSKVAKKLIIIKSENDESVPPIPLTPPVLVTPPLKVTGITPITLAVEKYARMGVSKKDNGMVSFSQKNENGHIFTMSFPKNSWGILVDDEAKYDVADAPKFAPLIVTDTKGNKLMMQFSTEKNGMRMRSLEIQSRAADNEVDSAEVENLINNTLKIESNLRIGGDDGVKDYIKAGLDSNKQRQLHETIALLQQILVRKDSGSGMSRTTTPHNSSHVKVFINNESRETDTVLNGKEHKLIVINKTFHIDSTMHTAKESVKRAEKELKEVFKKLHLENLDPSHNELETQIRELEKKIDDASDDVSYGMDRVAALKIHDMDRMASLGIRGMEELTIDLNHLVPILVRTATSEHFNKEEGITFDDGLLFWYDVTDDMAKAVPEIVTSFSPTPSNPILVNHVFDGKEIVTSADLGGGGIISKTTIFPNPARNKATLGFTLSEPRSVAFSIHDLLGKRVLEAGSVTETVAGSYEHHLDLRELNPGVYLLVMTTNKGEQNIQRLVIEK